MKKIFAITVSVFTIVIIVMMIAMPSPAISSSETSNTALTSSIPDSVSAILEKSCFPCHSDPGKASAMLKLNFDKWETYKPEKKEDKAEDICEELKKGGMPPSKFRSANPEKVPTQAEVNVICNWAASLETKDEK